MTNIDIDLVKKGLIWSNLWKMKQKFLGHGLTKKHNIAYTCVTVLKITAICLIQKIEYDIVAVYETEDNTERRHLLKRCLSDAAHAEIRQTA